MFMLVNAPDPHQALTGSLLALSSTFARALPAGFDISWSNGLGIRMGRDLPTPLLPTG